MNKESKFNRMFLIFKPEDPGYVNSQGPSGFVKVEVRNGKGKLYAMVQNLKEDSSIMGYRLYLLKDHGYNISPINVGLIPMEKNKGELWWEFIPDDLGQTGNSIADYGAAVVLAERKDRRKSEISCPLVAFLHKEISWRSEMKEFLLRSEQSSSKELFGENRDTVIDKAKIVDSQELKTQKEEINLHLYDSNAIKETESVDSWDKDRLPYNEINIYEEPIPDKKEEKNYREDLLGIDVNKAEMGETQEEDIFQESEGILFPGQEPDKKQGAQDEGLRKDDGSIDVDRLEALFDSRFEKIYPFRAKRRDYKWWKVTDFRTLNDLLYRFDIKTLLPYNPTVMTAHYKYGHLIVGIFSDFIMNRKFIVSGIPGHYGIEGRPFGEMCRWAQTDSGRVYYGAFGYWIVFMEPETGKLLRFT